jgi:hypothetical protein
MVVNRHVNGTNDIFPEFEEHSSIKLWNCPKPLTFYDHCSEVT